MPLRRLHAQPTPLLWPSSSILDAAGVDVWLFGGQADLTVQATPQRTGARVAVRGTTAGVDTNDPVLVARGYVQGADDYLTVSNADGRYSPSGAPLSGAWAGRIGTNASTRTLCGLRLGGDIPWRIFRITASTTIRVQIGGTAFVNLDFAGALAGAGAETGVWSWTIAPASATLYKNGSLISTLAHTTPLPASVIGLQVGSAGATDVNDGGEIYGLALAPGRPWSAADHARAYDEMKRLCNATGAQLS